nr:MAG TPA: hypothetical protein [Caudoviricetes sp.]
MIEAIVYFILFWISVCIAGTALGVFAGIAIKVACAILGVTL